MAQPEHDIRLSISDTSPIVEGSTARRALLNTLDLARLAETAGYHRYWVAEHHGMRGVASCATAVIINQLAASTGRIRVGSGGILLPNHSPLVIAEQFGTLEAYHPGRIDLGLGRAPGGSTPTVDLVRPGADRSPDAFADQIDELLGYFEDGDGTTPARAVPAPGNVPPVWVLGSGRSSAELAARRGLSYAFAHHLSPGAARGALELYRDRQRIPRHVPAHLLVSASVIASDTDARAEWLAGSTRLKVLRRAHGTPVRLPSPEDAAAYPYTADDRAVIDERRHSVLVGGPDTVAEGLQTLIHSTGVSELMITTPVYDHRDRRRSYELVAEMLPKLTPPQAVPAHPDQRSSPTSRAGEECVSPPTAT